MSFGEIGQRAPGRVSPVRLLSQTANSLLGYDTQGVGTDITVGSGLVLSNNSLIASGTGSGTVTSVTVVSANGFTGSVATSTTTPTVTLTTSINGLLKGNGTAISAAIAGVNYAIPATDQITYGFCSGL